MDLDEHLVLEVEHLEAVMFGVVSILDGEDGFASVVVGDIDGALIERETGVPDERSGHERGGRRCGGGARPIHLGANAQRLASDKRVRRPPRYGDVRVRMTRDLAHLVRKECGHQCEE